MATKAQGEFTMQTWDEQPYEEIEGGGKLTRARVSNAFRGDIDGESVLEFLMAYRDDDYASFVGIERVTGKIGGRVGSFVLQQTGTWDQVVVRASWFVVPGTATGNCAGCVVKVGTTGTAIMTKRRRGSRWSTRSTGSDVGVACNTMDAIDAMCGR